MEKSRTLRMQKGPDKKNKKTEIVKEADLAGRRLCSFSHVNLNHRPCPSADVQQGYT